jgi:predicted RNA-binding protein with PIN domain
LYYYLDGYNLLFSLIETKRSLAEERKQILLFLQKKFQRQKLKGTLVFDGAHRRDEESGHSYPSPLELVYTPKGQTADAYIIERIELMKNPRLATVVSNDRGLKSHAVSLGAKYLSNIEFIEQILRKEKRPEKEKAPFKETKQNIERLLKIFEEKLRDC